MSLVDSITPVKRRLILIFFDSTSTIASFVLSVSLLYSLAHTLEIIQSILWLPLLALAVRLFFFYLYGLYSFLWRYASTKQFINIVKAVTTSSFVLVTILFLTHLFPLHKSLLLIDWSFNLLFVGATRVGIRLYRDYIVSKSKPKVLENVPINLLIIGAGDCAEMMAREVLKVSRLNYHLVGFVDDKVNKVGQLIHGAPVLGITKDIPALVKKYAIKEAILAISVAKGKTLRTIMEYCEEAKVSFKITPGLADIIGGKVSINQIRDVQIEDLLGRDVVKMDMSKVANYLGNSVVLITGAGGSIGSELCRQIQRFSPRKLILLDQSEHAVYQIHSELLKHTRASSELVPTVLSVKDHKRLDLLFEHYKPDVVFHAAAHKHVPLMESNVNEVILNNILGTRNVLALSDKHQVKEFVLISTDKAVRPTSVMGASKRICEVLLQLQSQKSNTTFSAVRFGNVLGSQGSVIPLFKKQIESGGPITITHPDMTRYFMTIPEAVSLVLQTGSLSKGGEIFILDMGEPVKIITLARDLIQLSGLEEGKDIEIKVTGLRPGEKLFEELYFDKRALKKTSYEKVFVAEPSKFDREACGLKVNDLIKMSTHLHPQEVKDTLMTIISFMDPDNQQVSQ